MEKASRVTVRTSSTVEKKAHWLFVASLVILLVALGSIFVLPELLEDDCPPPAPIPQGFPSEEHCKEMVEYHVRHGLHEHENVPPEIRGTNYTAEKICVLGELTSNHSANTSSNLIVPRVPTEQDKQFFTGVSEFLTIGQKVWSLIAGETKVEKSGLFTVLPEGTTLSEFSGWSEGRGLTGYWNMAAAFYGPGARYAYDIEFDCGATGQQPQFENFYGLDNIRVKSMASVGHSHSLRVDFEYGHPENCVGHYNPYTGLYDSHEANHQWPAGSVVACIKLDIDFAAQSHFSSESARCTVEVHGSCYSRVVSCSGQVDDSELPMKQG